MNRLLALICGAAVLACGSGPETSKSGKAPAKTASTAQRIPYTSIDQSAETDTGHGGWMVTSSSDKMDDVTNVSLMLLANDRLNLPFPYNDAVPSLVIRCQKRKTDLFVVTHTPVETSHDGDYNELGSKIRARFDGSPPSTSYWSESTDHSAVFAPNPIALARKLSGTKEWLVEFTPFDAGPVTTIFDTDGLAGVLNQVAAACNWK